MPSALDELDFNNDPRSAVVYALFIILFVTSSFDIVFNLVVSGYSFRLVYVAVGLLAVEPAARMLVGDRVRWKMSGNGFFLLWFLTLLLFVANTSLLARNIGYLVWLILSYLLVITVSYYVLSGVSFRRLFYYYLLSFLALAILGILQFVLGLLGVGFYITQWWVFDRLPRVNGFSYEPSYYATYMIIGWTLLYALYVQNVRSIRGINVLFGLLLATVALILCSSRIGLLVMALACCFSILPSISRMLVTLRLGTRYASVLAVLVSALGGGIVLTFVFWEHVRFLFGGLGILGASSHSVAPRATAISDLTAIFLDNPLVGYSLGGIPYARAEWHGVAIASQVEAKAYEGANIFLEVLVASGIVGFVFFLLFFIALIARALRVVREQSLRGSKDTKVLTALIAALAVELVILCFNQNILRPYLWILIAMVNAAIIHQCRLLADYDAPEPKVTSS